MMWDGIENYLVALLKQSLDRTDVSAHDKLRAAFDVTAAYHAARLKPLLVERCGLTVTTGPFAGMRLLDRVSEGAFIPKLLGSYEAELHPVLERIVGSGYQTVVNIGCAEGYYAVGLARRTSATTHAFDIDERARQLCHKLARLNGVEDRVRLGSAFLATDFSRFVGQKALVLCDIEGEETSLLDPAASSALLEMDLLVEIHCVDGRWSSETLFPRFAASHAITEFVQEPRDANAYPALDGLSDADRFFALLERVEPTHWAFFAANRLEGPDGPTA